MAARKVVLTGREYGRVAAVGAQGDTPENQIRAAGIPLQNPYAGSPGTPGNSMSRPSDTAASFRVFAGYTDQPLGPPLDRPRLLYPLRTTRLPME